MSKLNNYTYQMFKAVFMLANLHATELWSAEEILQSRWLLG